MVKALIGCPAWQGPGSKHSVFFAKGHRFKRWSSSGTQDASIRALRRCRLSRGASEEVVQEWLLDGRLTLGLQVFIICTEALFHGSRCRRHRRRVCCSLELLHSLILLCNTGSFLPHIQLHQYHVILKFSQGLVLERTSSQKMVMVAIYPNQWSCQSDSCLLALWTESDTLICASSRLTSTILISQRPAQTAWITASSP